MAKNKIHFFNYLRRHYQLERTSGWLLSADETYIVRADGSRFGLYRKSASGVRYGLVSFHDSSNAAMTATNGR